MIRKRKRYIHLFEKSIKAQQAADSAGKSKTPRAPPDQPAAVVAQPLTAEEQVRMIFYGLLCVLTDENLPLN